MGSWDEKEAKGLFQKLLLIYTNFCLHLVNTTEKSNITSLKIIDLLHEVPFYDDLNIFKMSKHLAGYERTYKGEIVGSKDPLAQLESSKLTIKYLFKELLDEMAVFRYQITVKILLNKDKGNGDIEFAPVYFNFTTKTVINSKDDLDKSFQEILYRIDNCITEICG